MVAQEVRVERIRTQEQIAEKVVMIDHGGDGNGGGSGLNRFAQTGPTIIYALLQQLQALGLNVPDLLKQIGTSNDVDGVKVATEIKTTKEK